MRVIATIAEDYEGENPGCFKDYRRYTRESLKRNLAHYQMFIWVIWAWICSRSIIGTIMDLLRDMRAIIMDLLKTFRPTTQDCMGYNQDVIGRVFVWCHHHDEDLIDILSVMECSTFGKIIKALKFFEELYREGPSIKWFRYYHVPLYQPLYIVWMVY